ncbi:MAG: glycoside hydrolase family 68 protein [Tolypothrix brevis GSE-NOS-MK-07-07A]|jgi:beta-fructofuranosidase|nr:glycoside hydrolase family 68 protein [Tolypothrix brevis GSE-NOS-MK-07-07A]
MYINSLKLVSSALKIKCKISNIHKKIKNKLRYQLGILLYEILLQNQRYTVILAYFLLCKLKMIRTWDPWIMKKGNEYHAFCLASFITEEPFWMTGVILHLVSKDLEKWSFTDVTMQPDDCQWRNGRILAGSCVEENNKFYLFYSASPQKPNILIESIGMAVSDDLRTWQQQPDVLIVLDYKIYANSQRTDTIYEHCQCRDPYLVKCDVKNQYYLIFSTAISDAHHHFRGCIGLAVSQSIDGPYQLLKPLLFPHVNDETNNGIFYELERPQLIIKNGKYYLFFSAWGHTINPKASENYSELNLDKSALYCYVSDSLDGLYKPVPEFKIVPGSEKTGMYGTNFLQDEDGEWFAYGWYLETFTCEIGRKFPVIWDTEIPRILIPNQD